MRWYIISISNNPVCVKMVTVFQMWMNVATRWILVTRLFLKRVIIHVEAMSVYVRVDIVETVLNSHVWVSCTLFTSAAQ